MIREDSQLKPDVASQIVDKLIEKDRVPIITGVTFSNVMMAVHKKITEKEVFLIGSNAGPSPIAGALRTYPAPDGGSATEAPVFKVFRQSRRAPDAIPEARVVPDKN